jgi:hypothetical protein
MSEPQRLAEMAPEQMAQVIRLARRANLLASLAARCRAAETVPVQAEAVFEGAEMLAAEHARRIRWELNQLAPLAGRLAIPLVVLKGGAYQAMGLPSADGRLIADLDLLAPEVDLPDVERALQANGYEVAKQDEYDQKYYREWMHELPPMTHPARGTYVDVHHNIAPPVSRLKIESTDLLARAVPLEGTPPFRRLCDEDLVLHLCVHMFHDGELDNALRELFDLDALLRRFGESEAFWRRLVGRAKALGTTRPLHYGVHFAGRYLNTPVPDDARQQIERMGPSLLVRPAIRRLMWISIVPEVRERPSVARAIAVFLMFIRAHWLRMPPAMLVRHLFIQARRRGGLKTAEQAR